MKKLLFILTVLLPIQLFATTNTPSDTIKISIVGNQIKIEADNLQEVKELVKHDLNSILKNLNLSDMSDSSQTEINMELIVKNDSVVNHVMLTNSEENSEEGKRSMQKIISISDEGIFIKDKSTNEHILEISDKGVFMESELDIEENDSDLLIQLESYLTGLKDKEEEVEDSTKSTFMQTELHFGFNNYLNDEGKLSSGKPYSLKSTFGSFTYAKYAKTRVFANGPLFLKYGLSLNSNNYKFANNYVLTENEVETILIENTIEIEKSKLSTLFIDAPMMIQLDFSSNPSEENGFNVAVGAFAGYMIKAKTKVIYTDENNNANKDKLKGEFNLNKFRYGLQAQFGVLGWSFYGKYHLNSLFENNKGPANLNVIDFGIVFDI